jgi:hypothetical protein
MIDIREHGGIFGGGRGKVLSVFDVADNIFLPTVSSVSLAANNNKVEIDALGGDYWYEIIYSSETQATIKIYRISTMQLVQTLNVNAYYSFVMGCMMLEDANKFIFSVFSSNLNDSWENTVCYDTITWTLVLNTNKGLCMVDPCLREGNLIYGIGYDKQGTDHYQILDISTWTFTKLNTSSEPRFYISKKAGAVLWTDFYNSSIKGSFDLKGQPLTFTPDASCWGKTFLGNLDDIIYAFELTGGSVNGTDYKKLFVNYYTNTLQLIKREQINEVNGQYDPNSNTISVANWYVTKDKRYGVVGQGSSTNGLWSVELNNGQFKHGTSSLAGNKQNAIKRADVRPSFGLEDSSGLFFLTLDFTADRNYKSKSYLNLK